MFSAITQAAAANARTVGIFAHRTELIAQISRALRQFDVPHGIIAAGTRMAPGQRVYVCSAQTYARRIGKAPTFDLGIVDEAHHCTEDNTWGECIAASPNARWLGVTATPERLDGKGLGKVFDAMVLGPTPRELTEAGALCKARVFAPSTIDTSKIRIVAGDFSVGALAEAADKPSITGDAVSHYARLVKGAPSIAFCVSVAHARHVAEQFRAAGYVSASVDGRMTREARAEVMDDFAAGRINVLTSCALVSEGLDVPGVHGAILLRPTQSVALYLQQVGRALRPCDGKDSAVILDHAGNTQRHGMPDADRAWSLDGSSKSKRAASDTIKQCPSCYAAYALGPSACPECGYVPVSVEPEPLQVVDGELVEVTSAPAMDYGARMKQQASAVSLNELILLATQRGYRNPAGWARHVMAARFSKRQ